MAEREEIIISLDVQIADAKRKLQEATAAKAALDAALKSGGGAAALQKQMQMADTAASGAAKALKQLQSASKIDSSGLGGISGGLKRVTEEAGKAEAALKGMGRARDDRGRFVAGGAAGAPGGEAAGGPASVRVAGLNTAIQSGGTKAGSELERGGKQAGDSMRGGGTDSGAAMRKGGEDVSAAIRGGGKTLSQSLEATVARLKQSSPYATGTMGSGRSEAMHIWKEGLVRGANEGREMLEAPTSRKAGGKFAAAVARQERQEAAATEAFVTRQAKQEEAAARSTGREVRRPWRSGRKAGGARQPLSAEQQDMISGRAQLGLAGANIAQDVIQGGPASAINNLLGMANNPKMGAALKSLPQFFMGVVTKAPLATAALSGFAVGVGIAGIAINRGLGDANLGWSDFTDVVGNLTPFKAASEALKGLGEMTGFTTVDTNMASLVNTIADYTLGWNAATDAVNRQKEATKQATQALQEYQAAQKKFAEYKSPEQAGAAARGKVMATALAGIGGKGGAEGLARELAERETRNVPKDEKGKEKLVDVTTLDEKGNEVTEQITHREQAYREIMRQFGELEAGNDRSLGQVLDRIKAARTYVKPVKPEMETDFARDKKGELLLDEQGNPYRVQREREDKELQAQQEKAAASRAAKQGVNLKAAREGMAALEAGREGIDLKAQEAEKREWEATGDKNAREYDKAQKERIKARAEDLAGPLADRFAIEQGEGGSPYDVRKIQEKLEKSGALAEEVTAGRLQPDEAAKVAQEVLDKLFQDYGEQVREKATQEGITHAQASARLVAEGYAKIAETHREAGEKEAARFEAAKERATGTEAWKKAEDEEAGLQQERVQKATGILAGTAADTRTEGALLRARLQLGPDRNKIVGRVTGQMAQELVKGGMKPEEAQLAATQKVSEAFDKLNEEMMSREGKKMGQEFEGGDQLHAYVQGSVGPAEKLVELNEQMKDFLGDIRDAAKAGGIQ